MSDAVLNALPHYSIGSSINPYFAEETKAHITTWPDNADARVQTWHPSLIPWGKGETLTCYIRAPGDILICCVLFQPPEGATPRLNLRLPFLLSSAPQLPVANYLQNSWTQEPSVQGLGAASWRLTMTHTWTNGWSTGGVGTKCSGFRILCTPGGGNGVTG